MKKLELSRVEIHFVLTYLFLDALNFSKNMLNRARTGKCAHSPFINLKALTSHTNSIHKTTSRATTFHHIVPTAL